MVRVLVDSRCQLRQSDVEQYGRVLVAPPIVAETVSEATKTGQPARRNAGYMQVLKAIETVGAEDVVLIVSMPATMAEPVDDLATDVSYLHSGRVRVIDTGARAEANRAVVVAAASAAQAGATLDDVVAAAEAVADDARLVAALDVSRNWNDDGAVGLRGWYY